MNKNNIILFLIASLIFTNGCGKRISDLTWNFLDKNKLEVREIDFDYFPLSYQNYLYLLSDKSIYQLKCTYEVVDDETMCDQINAVESSFNLAKAVNA